MKKIFAGFGLVVAVMLSGCVAQRPYYGYGEQYPIVSEAPVQYAPPQQQVAPVQQAAPVYVGCRPPYVPSWNGCVMPSVPYYPAYYPSPMLYGGGYYGPSVIFTEPWLRLRINIGKGHGGGRHHRR